MLKLSSFSQDRTLAAEEPLDYIYQRAALAYLLWTECRGWRPAEPFLETRLQALIEQAETTYTADGVAALRLLHHELHQQRWEGLSSLPAEEGAETEDDENRDTND